MTEPTIERFRGRHFFLSNMCPLKNWIVSGTGIRVPTTEHVYQAAKFSDPEISLHVARAKNGLDAKRLAHDYEMAGAKLIYNWQVAKFGVMRVALWRKYAENKDMRDMLLATGDARLVEGNDWGDEVWGVCPVGSNNGENHLGLLHEEMRQKIRAHPEDFEGRGEYSDGFTAGSLVLKDYQYDK
jgi:ribA/ribD-fused uncharacterized protein